MEVTEHLLNEVSTQTIDVLERGFLKLPQVECPVLHLFGPGIYIRQVTIPAGTCAIGHFQKGQHTNMMLSGRVTIVNEDKTFTTKSAPDFYIAGPGRKIGFIHSDVTWWNIYPNPDEERDISVLEDRFLVKSIGWYESNKVNDAIDMLSHGVAQDDFDSFLSHFGIDKKEIDAESFDESDMTNLPFGVYAIRVNNSVIHGRGLFATHIFNEGDIIAPALIEGKRTIAGRFTNHSPIPNAKMVPTTPGNVSLVAIRYISGSRGGNDGEEITIDYSEVIKIHQKAPI